MINRECGVYQTTYEGDMALYPLPLARYSTLGVVAAKMVGKPHREETRADWDLVRIRIMRWCLRVKLAQHWSTFGELLLSTEDRPIVEESERDDFWGAKPLPDGTLIGVNVLGRLLSGLRDDLQGTNADAFRRVEPQSTAGFLTVVAVHARGVQ